MQIADVCSVRPGLCERTSKVQVKFISKVKFTSEFKDKFTSKVKFTSEFKDKFTYKVKVKLTPKVKVKFTSTSLPLSSRSS